MFRSKYVALVALALAGLLAAPAAAATITGGSGLINIPNADALRPGSLEISGRLIDKIGVVGLNVGVVPQVELGVYTVARTSDMGITLKGVLVPESKQMPGIAVGLENDNMYLVFSRSYSQVRGHLGFGNGRYNGPFFGLSMMLNRTSVGTKGGIAPVTTLLIEHDGRDLNAGARIAVTPQMKIDAAFLGMDEAMLGISFQTGM